MDSFFARFRNPLTLMAIVLVQVLALAMQVQKPAATASGEGRKTTLLRHWTLAIAAPFERLTHGTGGGVRHAWADYVDLRHTRQQNKDLQAEIARMRTEEAQFAEDAREGRRLETLLKFQQSYVSSTAVAEVMGTSGSDRSRIVTLNKGFDEGLRAEQAVMTPDGVVGKLRDVGKHTAQLLLLNDPASGAGVVLAETRIRGILHGTADGKVAITNLTRDSRIKPGEEVITSGGDQVFPRGLKVGVIESIIDDPAHQPYTLITIKPYANLSRLEEVLVVTGTQDSLTPQAASDAAAADATAEASKRAADVVAERLPGLKAEDEKDAAPKLDAQGHPVAVIPRPKPVLHPDAYSPGAAPPADSLTPGGTH